MNQEQLPLYQSLPNPNLNYVYNPDDEIDIVGLILKVWSVRRTWFITCLSISLLFWSGWLVKYLATPDRGSYSLPIQLSFSGVDKGKYPNGTQFLLSDIVAPVVLNKVHSELLLSEYGITAQQLMSLVSVTPYIRDEQLIDQKYAFLQDEGEKTLTPQELDQMRDAKQREKAAAAKRSAILYYNAVALEQEIPKYMIQQILLKTVEQWSEFRIDKLGVLSLDLVVYGDKIFDETLIKTLDYPILFEYLSDRVTLIRHNINTLSTVPNANLSSAREDEYSLPELAKILSDIETFKISPLRQPVLSLGISKDETSRKATIYYYQNKLENLMLVQQTLNDKASVASRTFSRYTKGQNSTAASELGQSQSAGMLAQTTIPQFGDAFLDRIIDMSSESSDIKYRQQLMDQQLSLENQSIDLAATIKRTERILKALTTQDPNKAELKQIYNEKADGMIDEIIYELTGFTDKLQHTARRLSTKNLGSDGLLYAISNARLKSTNKVSESKFNWVLYYLILMVLTTLICLPLALIVKSVRQRTRQKVED